MNRHAYSDMTIPSTLFDGAAICPSGINCPTVRETPAPHPRPEVGYADNDRGRISFPSIKMPSLGLIEKLNSKFEFKPHLEKRDVFKLGSAVCLVLVALGGFSLGYLNDLERVVFAFGSITVVVSLNVVASMKTTWAKKFNAPPPQEPPAYTTGRPGED